MGIPIIDKGTDPKARIKWSICLVLAIACALIPTTEIFTMQLKLFTVTTVFALAMMAFELLPIFVIAIFLPCAWMLTGVTTSAVAYSGWLQSSAHLIISMFLFTNILDESGLLNRLGYWCIVRFGGTLNGAVWGVFIASILLAMATFTTGFIMVCALAYSVCKAFNLQPRSKEAAIIMIAAMLGGATSKFFLYCPVSVTVLGDASRAVLPDFTLPWTELVGHNFPTFFMVVFLMWFFTKLYKTKQSTVPSGKAYFEEKRAEMGKMTMTEKKCAVLLVMAMIYMLSQPWHGLDNSYGFILVCFCCFLPGINTASMTAVRNIPFDMAFLTVTCLGIGTVATSLGIGNILAQMIAPVMMNVTPTVGLYATLIFGTLANFVLTPFAMMAALPAPIISYCLELGWNPVAHIYALYLSTDIVFLPYEFMGYITLYAFGMISMKDLVSSLTIKAIAFFIFFGIAIIPFWKLLGIV